MKVGSSLRTQEDLVLEVEERLKVILQSEKLFLLLRNTSKHQTPQLLQLF
jgi:hypothetical protein